MQIVHLPHERDPLDSAVDWLEVRRGRTRFPRRPLNFNRILIGSGSNCHLQLGGGLPMLHSLLVREGEDWILEAIAPEPWVFINDRPVRHEPLAVGDTIRLIEFEFVLHRGGGDNDRRQRDEHRSRSNGAANEMPATDGMNALQLVNCIEQEFDLIETLEPAPARGATARGATALLRAIRRHGRGASPLLSESQKAAAVSGLNPSATDANVSRAA